MGIKTDKHEYWFDNIENVIDYIINEVELSVSKVDEDKIYEQLQQSKNIIKEHYKRLLTDYVNKVELENNLTDNEIILELYNLDDSNEEHFIRELFSEEYLLESYKSSSLKFNDIAQVENIISNLEQIKSKLTDNEIIELTKLQLKINMRLLNKKKI